MANAITLHDAGETDAAPQLEQTGAETPQPWEQIETGRYQPRRIRGSCRGRELG